MRLTSLSLLVGPLALSAGASAQDQPSAGTAATVPPAASSDHAPVIPFSTPAPSPSLVPYQPLPTDAAGPQPAPPYQAPPNLQWVLVDPKTMQPPPPPGFHKHDGFFMRFHLGVALSEMRGDVANGQLRLNGQGFAESLILGGSLNEHVVLYGDYFIEGFFGSSKSGAGQNRNADEASHMMLGFAPGVAYYFNPSNYYISGALGMVITFADEENQASSVKTEHRSSPGLGGNLSLGREWWVSDNWGLGAALRCTMARTKERDTGYPWLYYSLAVLFSATYN